MFKKTKQLCDTLLQLKTPGFDFMVYHRGKLLFRHQGGYSDLEKKIPICGTEKFNLYSCSKPITCTAAMQLWERGLFSLEDPLSRYLPEYENMTVEENGVRRPAAGPIKIHHLFEMTAGFSYNRETPPLLRAKEETGGLCPTRTMIRALAEDPLGFDPGDQYRYSLCHDVLACLVEVLAEEPFEDYVQKNIFRPLEMENSTYLFPYERLDEISPVYRFMPETGTIREISKIPTYRWGRDFASGGAGAVSTVADYLKFSEGLRTGKLLKEETLGLMLTDRLTPHQKRTLPLKESVYGLGMRVPKPGGSRDDFGWGGAAGAFFACDLKRELSLFYFQHMLASPAQGVRERLYRTVLEDAFGEETGVVIPIPKNYDLTY